MVITRQHIVYYLRKFHLLKFTDHFLFLGNVLKNRKSNQEFLAEYPGFVPPPAHLAYDAYNHTNLRAYYNMGLKHSELISDLIKKYIFEHKIKVCEWGCGPARVIRHLYKINGYDKIKLYGTDYNEESVNWCRKNFKNVQFLQNSLEPPIVFDSNLFNCVYAISIFTHLSEKLHYAWIKELFRIIKPGGILIFTTHGDLCANKLLPAEKEKYDSGCLVVKGQYKEGKKYYATYHPPQFIREKLLKDHLVLEHIRDPSRYQLQQEIWCVKREL